MDQSEYLKRGRVLEGGIIVTPEFRVSYPFVFQPRKPDEPGKSPKFSINCLFPLGTDLGFLQQACINVMVKEHGPMDQGRWPANFKKPFKSQTDRVGKDKGYIKDGIFIIPNSKTKPGLVNAMMQPIVQPSDIYAGCWGVAMVRCYWYKNKLSGVGIELINFQKTRDDEPLGTPRATPEMGFTAVGEGAGASVAAGFMPQGGASNDPFATPPSGTPQFSGTPSEIFR